jgi:hypothetical protein
MLLSGQDVAYFEGGGSPNSGGFTYFHEQLHTKFVKDDAGTFDVTGTGPFAGLQFTLNQLDSARNQQTPDEISPYDRQSSPAFVYGNGAVAGLRVDVCVPGRALVLGFGLEAVGPLGTRAAVLGRAIDWLIAESGPVTLDISVPTKPAVTQPGVKTDTKVMVFNTGLTTDTVTVDLGPSPWVWNVGNGEIMLPTGNTFALGPCQVQDVDLSVSPPWDAKLGASEQVSVTAKSGNDPSIRVTGIVTGQTTAPLLLVDDDRWFQVEGYYDAAFDAAGIPHDMFPADTVGSPTVDILKRYGAVVWFTGYDWFDPINKADEGRLGSYLDQGGRLFLLSQGYLDYQDKSTFPSAYLGTIGPRFDITTTKVSGVNTDPIGKGIPQESLNLPYPAYVEVITPTQSANVGFVNDVSLPLGVSTQGDSGWRSIFFSFGLEGLAPATAEQVARQSFAWLGSLVGTALRSDHEFVHQGETFTLGLVLQNQSAAPLPVSATVHVPAGVTLVNPDPGFDAATRTLRVSTTVTPTSAAPLGYAFKVDPDFHTGAVAFSAVVTAGDERLLRQFSLPVTGRAYIPAAGIRVGDRW